MSEQPAIGKSIKHIIRTVAGATALLGALGFAQAGVVDPTQPVAGTSQLELSQQWWQWVLGIPASGNPLFDTDGALARTDNNGAVFFVAGNVGGISTRTFSVPTGRPLFFPILNSLDLEIPQSQPNCFDPGVPDPLACALAVISPGMDNASNLHATLDGQNLLTFPNFRQTSTSFFDIELPDGNLFGIDAGLYASSAVSDGYWVALEGLSPGRYTLNFGGTGGTAGNEFTVEVTDTLNVPEPGTPGLVLLGALVALSHRRFSVGLRYLITGREKASGNGFRSP